MKKHLILKSLSIVTLILIVAGCFSTIRPNQSSKTNDLIDQKKITALFIGHSLMNKQEFLIPKILRTCGYETTERHCFSPGQSFEGHIQNNLGIVTEEQIEGIERGRIGGWFSDEKCDLLYEILRSKKGYLDDALAEMTYDVAFITSGGNDNATIESEETRRYFRQLCEMLRANNPDIRIVFTTLYAPLTRNAEDLPMVMWAAKRLALEFDCRIAPIAMAMRAAEEQFPETWFFRSKKDFHPNNLGCILLSYSYITAMFDNQIDSLPTSLPKMILPGGEHSSEEIFSLEEDFGKAFLNITQSTTAEIMAELEGPTLDQLKKPVIEKKETQTDPLTADIKLLVIGNAYFDADGAVWRELANGFKVRDKKVLHVETLTDDAATFESTLANNEGKLTKRQQWIIEEVGKGVAAMGDGYDMDALDGMGDFPMKTAMDFILSREGELDRVLATDVPWDAVIVQGFRGALDPAEHSFFESGAQLIEKIRAARPDAPLYLMQHWKYKDGDHAAQETINQNYEQLAAQCDVQIIPIGKAWLKTEDRGVNLYAGKYAPNKVGIQLAAEEIRAALLSPTD